MLSSSSSACLSASLGDKAWLFSCANILQIADVVHRVVFLLLLLCYLGNKSPISSWWNTGEMFLSAILPLTTKTTQPRPPGLLG